MFAINLLRKCRQFLERLKCNVNDYLRDFKWKGRIERLPLPIKSVLVFLYLSSKYAWILLKLKILPIAISGVVLSGFLSKDVSIVVAWLILCIFTYEYFPKVTAKLYGDFVRQWWVRGIITVYAFMCYLSLLLIGVTPCLPSFLIQYCNPDLFIVIFLLLFIFSLPFSAIFRKESAMENWKRPPVPLFWEFIDSSSYKEWDHDMSLKHPYRELSAFTWSYAPALFLFFLGVLFGFFYSVFTLFSVLLTILIIAWLFNDIYYVIKKKSPIDEVLNTILKGRDVKEGIYASLFSSKTSFKQWCGIICLGVNFFIIASFVFDMIGHSLLFLKDHSVGNLTVWIPILPYFPIFSYQFYFLYILSKRFNKFLDVMGEYSKGAGSKGVDVAPLPISSIFMFMINLTFIALLFRFAHEILNSGIYLYFAVTEYGVNYLFTSSTRFLILLFFLSSMILSIINISLLIHSLKKKKSEVSRKDLYRDNIRIPVITTISTVSFCFSHHAPIINGIIAAFMLILLFYIGDWSRIIRSKYSENLKKGEILLYRCLCLH